MKLIKNAILFLTLSSSVSFAQGALYPTPRDKQNPPSENAPAAPPLASQSATSPSASTQSNEQTKTIAPIVEAELSETEVLVGQPIRLQVKVLVPTYMPKPPVYPTIELPDLMVRLPDRATTPTSERRDGESLSGTIRTYRLYPLAAGTFVIPAQALSLTYADPVTNAPVTADADMGAQSFTATLPAAAQALDPPVIAAGFTLEQKIEGDTSLSVGDAITRTVTAQIDGTTPVLIPPLIPGDAPDALRAYPKEPRVAETEERGTLSGARTETVTYLVQTDGTAELPAISIEWYDTGSQSIQTANLPAVPLTLAPAPPPPPDYRKLAQWGVLVIAAMGLLWLLVRRYFTHVTAAFIHARNRYQSTEHAAAKQVQRAISSKNLTETYSALEAWSTRAQALEPSDWLDTRKALIFLGSNTYGASGHGEQNGWRNLSKSFDTLRKTNNRRHFTLKNRRILPQLNTDHDMVMYPVTPKADRVAYQ